EADGGECRGVLDEAHVRADGEVLAGEVEIERAHHRRGRVGVDAADRVVDRQLLTERGRRGQVVDLAAQAGDRAVPAGTGDRLPRGGCRPGRRASPWTAR